jgi:potassium-transporting ATPase KdpC subunit
MTRLFWQSLRLTVVFTVLTGLIYPLVVTGIAQLAFHDAANGSLVRGGGQTLGSALLAQKFTSPRYFWPRPSAADYATVPSGASNLGPTSSALQSNVAARVADFRAAHNLAADIPVPGDMVFASGSGLDPHISPAAARLQVQRIAAARGQSAATVEAVLGRFIEPPQYGFLGEPRVNVLLLNLALDKTVSK